MNLLLPNWIKLCYTTIDDKHWGEKEKGGEEEVDKEEVGLILFEIRKVIFLKGNATSAL